MILKTSIAGGSQIGLVGGEYAWSDVRLKNGDRRGLYLGEVDELKGDVSENILLVRRRTSRTLDLSAEPSSLRQVCLFAMGG